MVVVDDEADPEETKRVPSVRQTRNSVIRIELISIIAVVRSLQSRAFRFTPFFVTGFSSLVLSQEDLFLCFLRC